jgi:RNA polymerase sigma factor (sigma-70 family)
LQYKLDAKGAADVKASPLTPGLVEAAQRGEAGAIEQLLAATKPDLQRFARRLCAGPEDAEDAVQNALWILHRKVGALRAVPAFAGWLFRVVARECRRLMRNAGISLDPSDIDALAAPRIPSELQRDLAKSIEALPDAYRTVLIMRDIEEMTAPETAEILKLSPEAVKSRLRRARERVRESLLAGGYFGGEA